MTITKNNYYQTNTERANALLPENLQKLILSYIPSEEGNNIQLVSQSWRRMFLETRREIDFSKDGRANLRTIKARCGVVSQCPNLTKVFLASYFLSDSLIEETLFASPTKGAVIPTNCHSNPESESENSIMQMSDDENDEEELFHCSPESPSFMEKYFEKTTLSTSILPITSQQAFPSLTDISILAGRELTSNGILYIIKKLPMLKRLHLNCAYLDDLSLSHIASHASNLEILELENCSEITDAGISYLANNTALHKLKVLQLHHCNQVTAMGLRVLANSRCLRLERLYLRSFDTLSNQGILALVNGPAVEGLTHLQLCECSELTDSALRSIACSTRFGRSLRWLDISYCTGITDEGLRQLVSAKTGLTRCLRTLDMSGLDRVSDRGMAFLCQGLATGLEVLELKHCFRITDRTLVHIGQYLNKLRYLNVRGCELLTDEGVKRMLHGEKKSQSTGTTHGNAKFSGASSPSLLQQHQMQQRRFASSSAPTLTGRLGGPSPGSAAGGSSMAYSTTTSSFLANSPTANSSSSSSASKGLCNLQTLIMGDHPNVTPLSLKHIFHSPCVRKLEHIDLRVEGHYIWDKQMAAKVLEELLETSDDDYELQAANSSRTSENSVYVQVHGHDDSPYGGSAMMMATSPSPSSPALGGFASYSPSTTPTSSSSAFSSSLLSSQMVSIDHNRTDPSPHATSAAIPISHNQRYEYHHHGRYVYPESPSSMGGGSVASSCDDDGDLLMSEAAAHLPHQDRSNPLLSTTLLMTRKDNNSNGSAPISIPTSSSAFVSSSASYTSPSTRVSAAEWAASPIAQSLLSQHGLSLSPVGMFSAPNGRGGVGGGREGVAASSFGGCSQGFSTSPGASQKYIQHLVRVLGNLPELKKLKVSPWGNSPFLVEEEKAEALPLLPLHEQTVSCTHTFCKGCEVCQFFAVEANPAKLDQQLEVDCRP